MLKGMKKTLCLLGLTAAMLIGSQSESQAQVYYQTEIRPVTYTNYHPYYGYYTETRYEPVSVAYQVKSNQCSCEDNPSPQSKSRNPYPKRPQTAQNTWEPKPGDWGIKARR